ncbi:MAG: ATP-binding protein [Bacteroidales bacterium]|nr:ATP-binding protein [Bacteroidales bacterium]
MLIGRKKEQAVLRNLLEKEESQFCAVYGRRRVGKTYLIRETFNYQFAFQHTGFAKASLSKQLAGFRDSLQHASGKRWRKPRSWMEAFGMLEEVLAEKTERKKVVFLDELSWMDTPKSNFVSALEHFWNSWATARREKDIVLIVCGSSSSWITKKIFRNRGGLHNRLTERIHLAPFCLAECERYAEVAGLNMSRKEITEAYMVLGGVPYYWSLLEREYSLAQNVDRLFFDSEGKLRNEFGDLYASLFENTQPYLAIVEALGEKKIGMTRLELETTLEKTSSGTLTKRLEDLELSGFIRRYACIGKRERDVLYQLIDPFTLFYFSFMKDNRSADEHYWSAKLESPVHNTWAGLAFERVCLWHVPQIKQALGIAGVSSQVYSWTYRPKTEPAEAEEKEEGAQIDLLIDRNDKVINLCEMKYADTDFQLSAHEEERIRHRRSKFVEITKTRKAVHITLVTTYGLKRTAHAGIVQQVVSMEDLFKD